MRPSSDITLSDYFCGAGGSSTGAAEVPGVRVVYAANHWKLAIETHAANHPTTEHDLCDLQVMHPSQTPRTTIAWFSPECTNHAVAKGRKRKSLNQLDLWNEHGVDPADERSRATMREVVEFSEYHRYEAVIVENVTEIRHWQYYGDWLQAMMNLGYLYKEVFFNSMFAHPTPQSRDRIYVVFWKYGNQAPDLNIRPLAYCETCGKDTETVFSPKSHHLPGRVLYGKSYVYRCPTCAMVLEPYYYAAFNAIDWSLSLERIGDRERPLVAATMNRIQRGLNKYRGQYMVIDYRQPMPFIQSYYTRKDASRAVEQAMPTVPSENRHALIMPAAFTYTAREFDSGRSLDKALKTVIATANQHALVMPQPMLSTLRGPHTGESLDKPMTAIVGTVQQALVAPQAFLSSYYGTGGDAGLDDAAPTMTSKDRHAFIQPEVSWDIEDAGFRMLQPHEIKIAMGFPDGYVVLGNKSEQVKQLGNAVTCPAARILVERVVASLM